MASTCITAAVTFAGTNIDDIFILMILYTQARSAAGFRAVILGQYLGITALTAISILGALGTQLFPPRYIGLLGFLPLFLGIRAWLEARSFSNSPPEAERSAPTPRSVRFYSVALLTIANGADNIGVYIPVFSGYTASEFAATLLVYAAMTALWCLLGRLLSAAPCIQTFLTRSQKTLVPAILIFLGLSILSSNYLL